LAKAKDKNDPFRWDSVTVLQNFDPRAKLSKKAADEVCLL
jgi:hypothetical protein